MIKALFLAEDSNFNGLNTGQIAGFIEDNGFRLSYKYRFDFEQMATALQPSLPYDTKKDLATVALIGTGAMAITTNAGSSIKTFADAMADGWAASLARRGGWA